MTKKSEVFGNIVLGVLAVCALAMTGAVVYRQVVGPPAPSPPARWVEVADWRTYLTGGRQFGATSGDISIVAFSDFQCPYCKTFAGTLQQLQAKYPGRISVTYRHYPLTSIHPFAQAAAIAAECAGEQGRFQAFHDTLFASQESIGKTPWDVLARRAAVPDRAAFAACLASPAIERRVAADVVAGDQLGVRGTPTIVINGRRLRTAPTLAFLDSIVDLEPISSKR